jgi:replicative DNA helicase
MHIGQDAGSSQQVEVKPETNWDKTVMLDIKNTAEEYGFSSEWETLPDGSEKLSFFMSKFQADAIREQEVGKIHSVNDELPDTIKAIEKTQGLSCLGLETPGLPQVNDALYGWRGLCFFAAEPGAGKTTFTLQVLEDVVSNNDDACGVFFSFEMSRREVVTRMICRCGSIGYRHLVCGQKDWTRCLVDKVSRNNGPSLHLSEGYYEQLNDGLLTLKSIGDRIAVIETRDIGGSTASSRGRVGAMLEAVDRVKRRTGCSRAFVVVDNMQAMPVPNLDQQSDLDRDRDTIAALGEMQHSLNDPVVIISEQAKSRQGVAEGVTSMLGTGRSGYAADSVLLLHRPHGLDAETAKIDDDEVCVQLTIAKGRDGVIRRTIPMRFNHRTMTFYEGPNQVAGQTVGDLIREMQTSADVPAKRRLQHWL